MIDGSKRGCWTPEEDTVNDQDYRKEERTGEEFLAYKPAWLCVSIGHLIINPTRQGPI